MLGLRGLTAAHLRGNVSVKFIWNLFMYLCVYLCVSKQYNAQYRLSVSYAGSDRSSGLWEERAGSQAVSGVG